VSSSPQRALWARTTGRWPGPWPPVAACLRPGTRATLDLAQGRSRGASAPPRLMLLPRSQAAIGGRPRRASAATAFALTYDRTGSQTSTCERANSPQTGRGIEEPDPCLIRTSPTTKSCGRPTASRSCAKGTQPACSWLTNGSFRASTTRPSRLAASTPDPR